MVKAGIVEKRNYDGTGKGRDTRRETGSVSLHSLRHNCTSALKSSGASDSVAMDIVGHEIASVSRNYSSRPFEFPPPRHTPPGRVAPAKKGIP